jgi:glycosyltransferase involved in cell wall biosynthesis
MNATAARAVRPLEPIRVLDLRDTYEIGGPGKTIVETQRFIDRERFALQVAVFRTRTETGETPFTRACAEAGLPVHEVRGHNQYDPLMIGRLARLVTRERIDIVHAHESKSDLLACLASPLHGAKTMTTLHGWVGNSRKQRLLIGLDRRVVGRFDRVIAVSGRIREQVLAAGARPERVTLLHNAIVTERYRRTGRRGQLAEVLGYPAPPAPVLVTIGRLSREKGHADFLEALGQIAREGQAFSAVLIGDGPERANLERQATALGIRDRTHFPGYIARPERVLEEVDLMVLPSHTEGLPNVVLEALMMETPVLATRVGGTPEILTDGESGRLVPSQQPAALAAALIDFFRAPEAWRAMARQGRAVVEARFDFGQRTRQLEAIYTELAGRMGR